MPPRPGAPPTGSGARTRGRSLLSPSSAAVRHQPRPTDGIPSPPASSARPRHPRPMNGIVVAMIVMNWTFASSGSPAMKATASAACWGSNVGSGHDRPVRLRRARRDPLGHLGVRVADVDLAAGDVVGAAVERDRLGQAGDGVLGHRVADGAGPGRVGGDRPVVDDPPALGVLRLHHPHRVVRAQVGAGQVGGHDRLPPVGRQLVHRAGRRPGPRVVDEQVHPAEALADRARTARATDSASPTSAGTGSTEPAAARAAVSSRGSRRRPAAATCQPWPASVTVISRPSPEPAPVTTATR